MQPRGLVLVTGPTGSGKSTTLAAMIDEVNRNRTDHILTIEDPIEFVHRHKRCIVNQREIGVDATSFGEALRAALRQDPDVILVGEMRDLETIGIALDRRRDRPPRARHAAHAERPGHGRPDHRRLPGRAAGAGPDHARRVAAGRSSRRRCCRPPTARAASPRSRSCCPDDATRNLIRQGKVEQIYSIMQTATGRGMMTMEQSLAELVLRARDHQRRRARLLEPRPTSSKACSSGPASRTTSPTDASRRPAAGRELTMADDEKPTSIWKKEMSFGRKPRTRARPRAPRSRRPTGSIWKKELSFRKKAQDGPRPRQSRCGRAGARRSAAA